jgi:hypothetical protein
MELWVYNGKEGHGVMASQRKGMGYVTTMEGEEGAERLSQAMKEGKVQRSWSLAERAGRWS